MERFSWFNAQINAAVMIRIQWNAEAAWRYLTSMLGPEKKCGPWLHRMFYCNANKDYGVQRLR
eukprot:9915426-Lingulodinium_polyedra.AAC.1